MSALGAPGSFARSLVIQEAWVDWLEPQFPDGRSFYFTGTFSDDYGMANGCMLSRNVEKQFRRFLEQCGHRGAMFAVVENHVERDILHVHAVIRGNFSALGVPFSEIPEALHDRWAHKGFAKVLPVRDGCVSYVTKYLTKSGYHDRLVVGL